MLDLSKRRKQYFDLVLHDGTKLQIPPPSRRIYGEMLEISKKEIPDEEELGRLVTMVLQTNKQGIEITQAQVDAFDLDDMATFLLNMLSLPRNYCPTQTPNSHCPVDNGEDNIKYLIETLSEKLVCDYARISFLDLPGMQVDDYMALLRDAYIHKLIQTEEGREYLEKCWILEQTKPDRQKLRDRFS